MIATAPESVISAAPTGISERVDTRTTTRERQLSGSAESQQLPSDAKKKSDAELYGLLAEYRAGELAPEDVELGALPLDASEDMRRVAAHMRLLIGLRLAVGEDRPLPYSARLAAERMEWKDPRRASRAIRRLCDAGVIDYAGSMPVHDQPFGTKTYSPPLPIGANTIEDEPIAVERLDRPAVEPALEVENQAGVGDAQPARIRPLVASGNRAERVAVHASEHCGIASTLSHASPCELATTSMLRSSSRPSPTPSLSQRRRFASASRS